MQRCQGHGEIFRARQVKGFTLIEVMIVLFIIVLGIMALLKFHINMARGQNTLNQHAMALRIATDKLNTLRQYEQLESGASATYNDIATGTASETRNHTTYTLNWTVTTVQTPPHKTIVVTVSWTDAGNTLQTLKLDGVVSAQNPRAQGIVIQGLSG